MRVRDDRDAPAGERDLDVLADKVRVALVGGVDGDSGVAQHGLGAGRGDDDLLVTRAVADGDELAVVVAVLDLDVGQGRQAAGAPVDDPLGAIDEPVVEQLLEDRLDGPGEPLVHREALTRPVNAVAELLHLTEDPAARLLLPLPDALDERLAAEVVARQAVLGDLALHDVLRGDAGVVHSGEPQRFHAPHAGSPGERVLDRVVEGVAHVERPGHVGRGKHDAVRLAPAARVRCEVARRYPALVAPGLDIDGRVLGGQLRRSHAAQF